MLIMLISGFYRPIRKKIINNSAVYTVDKSLKLSTLSTMIRKRVLFMSISCTT